MWIRSQNKRRLIELKGIKVLDMIQKKLESEGIYKGKEVFQMPQDEEVEE